MIEIRFHGRGGQGAVVASNLLADAAFSEGKDAKAFPYFGVERRGAPVMAYTRISDKPIVIRSQIYEPDWVVVLDPTLLEATDVLGGLKPHGGILINTDRCLPTGWEHRCAAVAATQIAIKNGLGSEMAPIVNTAMLGAFSRFTGLVSLASVLEAIESSALRDRERNMAAAREAYDQVREL